MTKDKLIEKRWVDVGIKKKEAGDIYFMFFKFIIDLLKKKEKGEIDIVFKPLCKFRKI